MNDSIQPQPGRVRKHDATEPSKGIKAFATWSYRRRCLVFHVTVDGYRPFSFEVRLGRLLLDLRISEGLVIGSMRNAVKLLTMPQRSDYDRDMEQQEAA